MLLSMHVAMVAAAGRTHVCGWLELSCVPVCMPLLQLPSAVACNCVHIPLPAPGSDRMLGRLKGLTDPEAKRKAIGAEFIDVFRYRLCNRLC